MKAVQFILYVTDQQESAVFYSKLFQQKPVLNVPGMTEFQLKPGVKLGLMPEEGIGKMLSEVMPHPSKASGVPRCELYLTVNDAKLYIKRGVESGATLISAFQQRDWGDKVGYLADKDGHIIALAEK